ncbi:MAG TPA: c-type cytochrome [bacterium]|nr:c-type cytochrome [bacterium]
MKFRIFIFILFIFEPVNIFTTITRGQDTLIRLSDTTSQVSSQEVPDKPSEASLLFEKKCYSCHNIGQGDKKGPDLKGLSDRRSKEWLNLYIVSPSAMRKSGDPATLELYEKYAPEEMTDQDLSETEIKLLLDFIDELTLENKAFIPAGARLVREPLPEDIPLGRKLFTGELAFQKGSFACIGCHHIASVGMFGGGTLGPELTNANTKYNVPELINIMKYPNFPLMTEVMKGKEINDEEIVQLIAFLQDVNTRQSDVESESLHLLYWGIGMTLLLFLFSSWIWRNRFVPVRSKLYKTVYRSWHTRSNIIQQNLNSADTSAHTSFDK